MPYCTPFTPTRKSRLISTYLPTSRKSSAIRVAVLRKEVAEPCGFQQAISMLAPTGGGAVIFARSVKRKSPGFSTPKSPYCSRFSGAFTRKARRASAASSSTSSPCFAPNSSASRPVVKTIFPGSCASPSAVMSSTHTSINAIRMESTSQLL